MATVVEKTGIKREKGWLYYVDKKGDVSRARMARGGGKVPKGKPQKVTKCGIRREEGFLYFIGRRDEMIKTSGYRVSPTEIEEVAYDTGLVRDAVAIGVEDDRLGQHIVLAVAPVDPSFSDEELLARMRQQLPLYMVPAAVHVRDELPRSPNGKFDRTLLRDELTP